jgi:hypothetical protein
MNETALNNLLHLQRATKAPSLALQVDKIPQGFAEEPLFWSEEWLKHHLMSITGTVYFGVCLAIVLTNISF